MNLEQAYTIEKRSYDRTMQGILSISSPPTGQVGVVRQLSMDAEITSPRGYLKLAEGEQDLDETNLFSPAELLTPMSGTKDDGPRTAMMTTQSKHVIPCKKYDRPLVGNGADKALAHIISNDFVFKAKNDGKVLEINEETGLIILQYKDGSKDAIDIDDKVEKNGGKLLPRISVMIY